MKKLLLTFFSILCISSMYAAAFNWRFTSSSGTFGNMNYLAVGGDIGECIKSLTSTGWNAFEKALYDTEFDFHGTKFDVDGETLNGRGTGSGVLATDTSKFSIVVYTSTDQGATFYYHIADVPSNYLYEPPNQNDDTFAVNGGTGDTIDTTVMTSGTIGPVPEPTVLALLALGVAGVALRRKKVVA